MADILAAAVGEFSGASGVVPFPAGSSGDYQYAVVLVESDTAGITLAGWTAGGVYDHSGSLCRAHVFSRTLSSAASAGSSLATLTESANVVSAAITVDGTYGAATFAESGWTVSYAGPTTTQAGVRATFAMATEHPRTFAVSSGTILGQIYGGDGPAIAVAEDVVSGTAAGPTWAATDANDPGLSGSTQWMVLSVVFQSAAAPPPAGGAQPEVTGSNGGAFNAASLPMTLPAGAAGNGQYVAIAYRPAASATITPPAGFAQIAASDVDSWAGRLLLFERVLSGATPAGSVTFAASGTVEGAWAAWTVSGARAALVRNTAVQSTYQTTVAVPSVTLPSGPGLLVTVIGSNYPRTHAPGSGVTEFVDQNSGNGPSIAAGWQIVSAGASSSQPWAPTDAYDPLGAAGDMYRAITVGFVGGAGSPGPAPPPPAGTTGVTVTASGTISHVDAPGDLVIATTGSNGATASWGAVSGATGYETQYAQATAAYGSLTAIGAGTTTQTIAGLLPGVNYKFRVRTANGLERSAWSERPFSLGGATVASVALSLSLSVVAAGTPVTVTLQTDTVAAGITPAWNTGGLAVSDITAVNASGVATASVVAQTNGTYQISASVGNVTSPPVQLLVGVVEPEDLVLTVQPARMEPGGSTIARVTGTRGGVQFLGGAVSLSSTNSGVISPLEVGTMEGDSTFAECIFRLPAIGPGTTTLRATVGTAGVSESLTVGGEPLTIGGDEITVSSGLSAVYAQSNTVDVVVAALAPPVVYAASGMTAAAIGIEAPLASASRPKVRRMTHADQQAAYPGDDFRKFAIDLTKREHVFFTKSKLRG